jgi:hypothetical protein
MNVRDYHRACEILSLPRELIAYFNFRQDLLLRNPSPDWTEPQIAARFINEIDEPLTEDQVREILGPLPPTIPPLISG